MADIGPQIVKDDGQTPYQKWSTELDYATQELKKFHERAQRVVRKYIDERDSFDSVAKWFNLFYANCSILESALYAQLPKPAVSRKYLDYQDDVARVAALIIERCITQDLDDPNDLFDSTMRACVQDRLVPGLSQAWLRLETDTEEIEKTTESLPPTPGLEEAEDAAEPLQRITSQRVVVDYIFWKDFLWSPCRVWAERRWVAKKAYMIREELVKRFGDVKGNAIPLSYKHDQSMAVGGNVYSATPTNMAWSCACIYEIWDRTTRKVFWLSRDYPEILDEQDDPLGLVGFEPCPEPMLANVSTSNTTPRPDYYMIQDQYVELDTINDRISKLIQACKVVGVYDKAQLGIQRMLNEGYDNQLIPVDNWAMFAEKNGLKGTIDWLPLEAVVTTIQQLNQAREVIKGQIYELTGIADIVRGASKASETLGAQQIKAQFASIRIKKLQDEVARFASDIMRLKAEIMVKHFEPNLLIQKSNVIQTENNQFIGPAIELLKSEEGFEWRIQVTADTLAQADYAMEKADRIAFLQVVSGYLEKATAMFQASPGSGPLLVGMLKWAVAGFRNAKDVEGLLDKELDSLTKNPPQEKPDPEQQKLQMEQQAKQQDAQIKAQEAQQKQQMEMQKMQMEMAAERQRLQMENQKLQMELAAERQSLALEQQRQAMDLKFEAMMQAIKLGAAKEQAAMAKEKPSESAND